MLHATTETKLGWLSLTVMFVKRADVLQTEQKKRKLKNFKEASLRDRHSITLRGLQYTNLKDLSISGCVTVMCLV